MNKIAVIFMLALFPLAGYCQEVPDFLYSKVIAAINKNSVSILTPDEDEEILNNVATGNSKWLALYPKLTSEPFLGLAGLQEGINTALALALPVNINGVLKQVTADNINTVCGMPFIEPTPDYLNNYYELTAGKLRGVGKKGAACLSVLDIEMKKVRGSIAGAVKN